MKKFLFIYRAELIKQYTDRKCQLFLTVTIALQLAMMAFAWYSSNGQSNYLHQSFSLLPSTMIPLLLLSFYNWFVLPMMLCQIAGQDYQLDTYKNILHKVQKRQSLIRAQIISAITSLFFLWILMILIAIIGGWLICSLYGLSFWQITLSHAAIISLATEQISLGVSLLVLVTVCFFTTVLTRSVAKSLVIVVGFQSIQFFLAHFFTGRLSFFSYRFHCQNLLGLKHQEFGQVFPVWGSRLICLLIILSFIFASIQIFQKQDLTAKE